MNKDTLKSHDELSGVADLMRPSDVIAEDDFTRMKLEINNLIWMYGKKKMTLEQAEIIACKILDLLLHGDSDERIL